MLAGVTQVIVGGTSSTRAWRQVRPVEMLIPDARLTANSSARPLWWNALYYLSPVCAVRGGVHH